VVVAGIVLLALAVVSGFLGLLLRFLRSRSG